MTSKGTEWIRTAEAAIARMGQRDPTQNWQARYSAAQDAYAAAESEEEYAVVRDYLKKSTPPDSAQRQCALGIGSILMSADAAFLASQAATTQVNRKKWVNAAFDDLAEFPEQGLDDTTIRWLGSLAQVISMMAWRLWPDLEEPEIRSRLQRLAETVDRNVPAALSFPGDDRKTKHVRSILATLSAVHGDGATAIHRWESILGIVKDQDQFLEWFRQAFWSYLSEKRNENDAVSVFMSRGLRRTLRMQLERYRASFRSRVGRHWVSNLADEIWGQLLWDDITSGSVFCDLYDSLERNNARAMLEEISGNRREAADQAAADQITKVELTLAQRFYGKVPSLSTRKEEGQEQDLGSQVLMGHPFNVFTQGNESQDHKTFLKGLYSLEHLCNRHNVGYVGLSQPPGFKEIRSVLRDDELLVHYYVVDAERHPAKEVVVVAVGRNERFVVPVDLSAMRGWRDSGTLMLKVGREKWASTDISPLGLKIKSFRLAIQEGDEESAMECSKDLFDLLVFPLTERGLRLERYTRWVVVPSRVLNAVPFGALVAPDGKFLAERVAIVAVPSSSVWLKLISRSGPGGNSATLLGNPQLNLDEAEREIHEVGRKLEASGLRVKERIGPSATEGTLRADASDSRILHIAAHGEFPLENAVDEHALILAGDERLRARDVRRLDLHACKLATLSICNGGLYRFGGGNEPLGLMPAFLIAGAENVLGPMWPIEDSKARVFMAGFYDALLHTSPAEAVRQASVNLVRDRAEISAWAAFLLGGSGR